MKKVLLSLACLVLLVTSAFAILIDYQNTTTDKPQRVGDDTPLPVVFQVLSSATKTIDASIQDGASELHWAVISFVGVTIGDKVEIRDSRYAAVGDVLATLTATAANQTMYFDPNGEIEADSGLYYDISISGGSTSATIVFK